MIRLDLYQPLFNEIEPQLTFDHKVLLTAERLSDASA